MPIIIEGPDGAGKSTLAKALAEAVRRLTLRGDGFGDVITDSIGPIYRRYEEFAAANGSAAALDGNGVDWCIEEVLKCMS